ncbi:amino-acid acetyltransferase [Oleiphilus messinensis]|uniref:Amino-acid acetyltransferase n=1 Tax=Oleiphilus messinensis TaxID=141451 RepID=A0A1Y0I7U4_9GAMM|nr:SbcC/MukB-like Walker B domain-containing protein [Oleiphilus messinensis]ARU56577.1 amino-acid acetyltransferase [Oleiphilus messinensis]
MFLKKCIYVNWGNVPNSELEFGPINLFSGGNGSGKTTAADALQTVMTAAHDTLFTYNPGQDEATQRGRGGKQVRTLASYILGCDDGSYARLGVTDGYIAACFHPTEGEVNEPFTAVICCRARIEQSGKNRIARQTELFFLIIPGHELYLERDFVRTDDLGARHIISLDSIATRLKKDFPVEKYETKKAYLKRLYGALRSKSADVSEREALNAARAFSRFMAYKPVKSINDFVANEILEKKDLGDAIRTVSDLLKSIHGMESDANRLKESANLLNSAKHSGEAYIASWINYHCWGCTEAQFKFERQSAALHALTAKENQLISEKQANSHEREKISTRIERTDEQLLELTAKRLGFQPLQQKDELEKHIAQLSYELHKSAPLLLQQSKRLDQILRTSASLVDELRATDFTLDLDAAYQNLLTTCARQLLKSTGNLSLDLTSLFSRDWIDISPLESHLDAAGRIQRYANEWFGLIHGDSGTGVNLRAHSLKLLQKREQHKEKTEAARLQKQAEIDYLSARQSIYPQHIRNAVETIEKHCPGSDPRVLCDYVEVTKPEWQNAIEGYIGGARYSIIVQADCEAEAMKVVRNAKLGGSVRVIQSEQAKADASRFKVGKDSILQVLKFHHATAKDYITASYGNVQRVNDEEQLRRTRRGVTSTGLGSGAYSMWRCAISDADLVFGQGARERALAAKQVELENLLAENQKAAELWQRTDRFFKMIERISEVDYAEQLRYMVESHRKLQDAETQLSRLDVNDYAEIENELARFKTAKEELSENLKSLYEAHGSLNTELHKLIKEKELLQSLMPELEAGVHNNEANLERIRKAWPDVDVEGRLADARNLGKTISPERLSAELQTARAEMDSRVHQFESGLITHNQQSLSVYQIPYVSDYTERHTERFFIRTCDTFREIDRVHNQLLNNILVEKLDNLKKLKTTFNNTFVAHLCHAIYQAVQDGKRVLDELNRELEHHQFGADREHFSFGVRWVPEFKEYWDFFTEVRNMPNLGDGTTLFEADLSVKGQKVRDKLMLMLLSEDEHHALRELERISDYRNYRNYEIYKQPEGKQPIALSQYGTGSGGQLETPAYIIRAAAITSAFRFATGESHLRMVLVDEAFSKMDEVRSREVIGYLTKTLGLQLIFIMPTSKSGPFLDLISNQFVFSKCPSKHPVGELNTRVLLDRQQCNQDKIKALWAEHRRQIRHQFALDFMEEFKS